MRHGELAAEYRRELREDYEYERWARLDEEDETDEWQPGQFDTWDERNEYYGRSDEQ